MLLGGIHNAIGESFLTCSMRGGIGQIKNTIYYLLAPNRIEMINIDVDDRKNIRRKEIAFLCGGLVQASLFGLSVMTIPHHQYSIHFSMSITERFLVNARSNLATKGYSQGHESRINHATLFSPPARVFTALLCFDLRLVVRKNEVTNDA